MMPIAERRDEFDAMPDWYLLRLLANHNPLGSYSIGAKRGQLSRTSAIETLLRYEGYIQRPTGKGE